MSFNFGSVLPIIGGIAGFFGSGMNPAGAMVGYQLGSAAGGMMNKGSSQQATSAAPNIVSPGTIQEPGGSLLSGFPSVGALSEGGQQMAKMENAAADVPGAPGKASAEGTVGMLAKEYARQKAVQQSNDLIQAQIGAANRKDNLVPAPGIAAVGAMGGSMPHMQPQFAFLGGR